VAYATKTKAALNQIKTMLDGIAGTQATYKGIPESITAKVTASVSVGDRTPRDKAAGYHESDVNFFVEFAYRVLGNEGTAEDTVADWVDLFTDAWLADRTLGGVVRTSELDFATATEPAYRPTAGAEFRVYPVVVRTTIPR
jgi:hypothetical protein